MSTVIAAIDLHPSSTRILRHAAGFARLLSARLRVLHVTGARALDDRRQVLDFCMRSGPYEVDLTEDDVSVRCSTVSNAIYREARAEKAVMIVMGSNTHGLLTKLLLGSTATAVLYASAPISYPP